MLIFPIYSSSNIFQGFRTFWMWEFGNIKRQRTITTSPLPLRLFSFADRHPRAGVVKPQFRRMPSYLVWNHFMPSSCVAASSGGNSGEDPNKPRGIHGNPWDVLWFETNQKPTKSPSSACEHSPPFPPSTCGSSHGCRAGRGARRSPCRRYRCQGRTWCPSQCAPECRIWKRVNKRGFRRFMQCLNISKQRSFLTNTCGLQPLQTWNPNAWLPSKQASWCLHPTKKTSFCMNDPIPWIQCHTNQQVSGRRKHVTKNNIPSALRQFLTLFKRKMDENGPSMDDVPWFTYVDRKQKTVIFPRIFLSYVP